MTQEEDPANLNTVAKTKNFQFVFNSKAFSLIDLMVTISIISTLAMIAVPQYSRMQAKARSTEAKAALSNVFTAMASYEFEHQQFTVCIGAAGYAPPPQRYYAVGFHDVDFGSWTCNSLLCNELCAAAGAGEGSNRFDANRSASSLAPAGNTQLDALPTDIAGSNYIICAAGAVSASGPPPIGIGYDSWCIDESKTIQHIETNF